MNLIGSNKKGGGTTIVFFSDLRDRSFTVRSIIHFAKGSDSVTDAGKFRVVLPNRDKKEYTEKELSAEFDLIMKELTPPKAKKHTISKPAYVFPESIRPLTIADSIPAKAKEV